jgi:lysophospholipase L1-like esterase
VLRLHRQYNQIVREVAATEGDTVELLDLERHWATRADLGALFIEDGIHFTAEGSALAADQIAAFVTTNWDRLSR